MKLISVINNNEPIRIPTIPPTGNGENILICFIVVDDLVIVVDAIVVLV